MTEINLELLEKEAPELLRQIREAAIAEGVKTERARVKAILEINGSAEATAKAILDGVSAEGVYKLFYQAEKDKKSAALKELKDQAPAPVGNQPAHDKVDFMAQVEAYVQQHKCTRTQAMQAVAKADPQAHKDWLLSKQVKSV